MDKEKILGFKDLFSQLSINRKDKLNKNKEIIELSDVYPKFDEFIKMKECLKKDTIKHNDFKNYGLLKKIRKTINSSWAGALLMVFTLTPIIFLLFMQILRFIEGGNNGKVDYTTEVIFGLILIAYIGLSLLIKNNKKEAEKENEAYLSQENQDLIKEQSSYELSWKELLPQMLQSNFENISYQNKIYLEEINKNESLNYYDILRLENKLKEDLKILNFKLVKQRFLTEGAK